MKKHFIKTMLLALLCAVGGVGAAWADEVTVPTPVYFNDFSSTDGLTIVGNGEFITDADAHFGQIFHNDPTLTKAIRTNYLLLPSDVLSHSATTKQMTIGFWVNKKDAADNYWTPIFSAYDKAPYSGTLANNKAGLVNDWTMFTCESRGLLQYNLNAHEGGWCDFTADQNDNNANKEATNWLDVKAWHYYTVTLTTTKAIVYVDGVVFNSWTINDASAFFEKVGNLTYVCLGGNQTANFADPDPAYGFDDFAVYDAALSAEQIKQIINKKLLGDFTTYFYQDYEATDIEPDWTTSSSDRFIPTILEENGNHYLSVVQNSRNNNGATLTSTSLAGSVEAGTDFTMTFDLKVSSSTNQSPTSFTIFDAANANAIFSLTATGTWSTNWIINSSANSVNLPNTNKGNGSQSITDVPWYSIIITKSGSHTYLTIKAKADNSVILSKVPISVSSESEGGLGKMQFVTSRYQANFAIDNLLVRNVVESDVPDVVVYTVTTKYQLEDGTKIDEDIVANVNEGESYTPTTKSFVSKFYDYTYKEGATELSNVSENTDITIVYTKTLKAEYENYNILLVEDYLPISDVKWTTSVGGRFTPIIAENERDFYMTVDQNSRNNNGCELTGTLLKDQVEENTDFTLLFDFQLTTPNGKNAQYPGEFVINDKANSKAILKFSAPANNKVWLINDSETISATLEPATWYTAKLTRKGQKSYLTITNRNDNSVAFNYAVIPTLSETGGLGNMKFVTKRYNANIAMDNILVREVVNSEDIFVVYSVKAMDGEQEIATLASGKGNKDDEISVILSQVITKDGKYYVLNDDNIANYTLSFIMGDNDETQTINYTEDPTIVYFNDGVASSYMNVVEAEGYSGGNYATANLSANHGNARNRGYEVGNLSAGSYEITARMVNDNRSIAVRTNDGDSYNTGNAPLASLSGDGTKSSTFVLGGEKAIVLTGANNKGNSDPEEAIYYSERSAHMGGFDYIIIRKTGDEALARVKVTDAGYATFYSEYALDFTGTGLTAYVAKKGTEKDIEFEAVTTVPANTGILLKGEANTYDIPVIDSADEVSSLLTGYTIYKKESAGIYVLMNGANGVGFYKTANDFTVGAHTAYLPATVASGRAFIGFDDETTGIKTVSNAAENNGMIFNLNGQRVSSPKGGLYIKNGKKVIIK